MKVKKSELLSIIKKLLGTILLQGDEQASKAPLISKNLILNIYKAILPKLKVLIRQLIMNFFFDIFKKRKAVS